MLSSIDMGCASALERIRANVVRDDDELLWIVARCTALITTRLDNIGGALSVKEWVTRQVPVPVGQQRLRER